MRSPGLQAIAHPRQLPALPPPSLAPLGRIAWLLPSLVLAAAVVLALAPPRPVAAAAPGPAGAGQPTPNEAFPPSTSQQIRLADHLSRLGYVFYGAWWCPACTQQKSVFGQQAVEKLPYVECEKSEAGRQRCNQAGIRAYPTWVRGGERREGVLSLEELQRWSGFRPSAPTASSGR